MATRIQQALAKQFEKHRIVFWYDEKRELRSDFDSVSLDTVEKLELDNNEFALKHRILREEPKKKFLIYRDGPAPAPLDNWMLDVQLAHTEFRTDQVAIWRSELELGFAFSDLIEEHLEFFSLASRREKLKELIDPSDSHTGIRLKMLAVCANSEARLDTIFESLLDEFSKDKSSRFKLIQKTNLEEFLWQLAQRTYAYHSEDPSVGDFAIELFQSCFQMNMAETPMMNQEALAFLKRWQDSRRHASSFETLSHQADKVLDIESRITSVDYTDLMEVDYFEIIERKIIRDLVAAIVSKTSSCGDITLRVRERRQSHWHDNYRDIYQSIDYAAQFIQQLSECSLEIPSQSEGISLYTTKWYQVDLLYRKFIFHFRSSHQSSLLGQLYDQVENLYSNHFLLNLNDAWQSLLDAHDDWTFPGTKMQRNFYRDSIKPRKEKICIIISDAMRYEVAESLNRSIRSANKYETKLESMVSSLPSYTQLGMASLLPHKTLEITPEKGQVLLDGQSTLGLAARDKILKQYEPEAIALKAEDVLKFNRDEIRQVCRDHQVIYIYHNHIDATGDATKSEDRVFEAAKTTIEEVSKLVTRIGGENYIANFIVTADHGFIYQDRKIDESDFSSAIPEGDQISVKNRRFVIGSGLKEAPGLKYYSSAQLGLAGEQEVLIPKSINRLRVKGAGSKFVHGGSSLQEILVPLLHISKSKNTDVSKVEIEILRGGSTIITTGQIAVTFYQLVPATDKTQGRKMRAAIYTTDGTLISDLHKLAFDLTSDLAREREQKIRFLLTKEADACNGQEVILKLEEKNQNSTHYKEYKSLRYTVRRSIDSDFDF